LLRAVSVDRVDEQFARTALDPLSRPLERVEVCLCAPTVGRDDETGWRSIAALDVEAQHEHLRAETIGDLADNLWSCDRCTVDADLVRSDAEKPGNVIRRSHAPAHREWDEHLLCRGPNDVVCRRPIVDRRRDIQEGDFVRALLVVLASEFDGVARITKVKEVDPLDDAAVCDVEARDDPDRDTHVRSVRRESS
jgi:hypothetical protein